MNRLSGTYTNILYNEEKKTFHLMKLACQNCNIPEHYCEETAKGDSTTVRESDADFSDLQVQGMKLPKTDNVST